ncbi:integrase core domain-containing protein [Actinomadura montaniterrae]|uniref:integrase core domain-containing protein n=1 Tax=Actinomadura montaniterrae TaxID=1803903 RepID=UPI001CEF82E0
MLDGVVIDTAAVFNDKLREWEDYYNYDRPHGTLGGETPLRTPQAEDPGPGVNDHRRSHTHDLRGIYETATRDLPVAVSPAR